ncbi:protein lethal(2)essential for life-like isoform X2 [Schistocerca gregaria]|uniref:protein lethal(2)essential for life-like isoform X2 n=1 Tax=Schistocerca gregaria TaxID=7010 RepID=UPI00211EB590|nr:protein lethal(2)essential for life-like isoform X2 [Schistocerca gregaria]
MAALPLVYRILEELNQPTSQYDQGFGLGMLAALLSRPLHYQPICVSLDVQQFRPDEISVKKIDDFVVVEGKHDERKDGHGYVSRQFTRRYRLPDDIEVDQMVSKLSSDGVLTITAPKKTLPPSESRERIVPIVHTNQPAVAQSAPSRESGDNEIQETIVQ